MRSSTRGKRWRALIRQDGFNVRTRRCTFDGGPVTRPHACQWVATVWQQLALARLASLAGATLPKGRVPRRIEEMVRDAAR